MIRLLLMCLFAAISSIATAEKPNVLFISLDDLNDWVGCLGGHPQALTPNLDRLAASGTLFTNAHCPAPACNPSRGAIMTGISPHVSGLYDNRQSMRGQMPDAELLPRYFSNHGYWSAGSGKILHYLIDAKSWDEYYPPKETEDPFPPTFYPKKRPVSLPRGGSWQYIETDWAALDVTDEEFGGDWLVSEWIGEQLSKSHDKPFFLACGIYRPHEPWFVPKKYFDPFPLEEIELPPGYLENDLDDLPPAGKQRGPNRYFAHIRDQGQWKQGIQGYLASIYFADTMLGRVLDALENGPNKDNTIVVLWSDHGWHLGEKQHWQKYTGWRACTRVPLILRVPKGAPGLPRGTVAGTKCNAPVNLLSLFPTLTQLSGLPADATHDGPSLVPLLDSPNAQWPHASITYLGRPGNFGVSGRRFRYIHYDNGDEELYDIETDRYEWNNLAPKHEFANRIAELKAHLPKEFAEYANNNSGESLPDLKWTPFNGTDKLVSQPKGDKFEVRVSNEAGEPIKIFSIDSQGEKHSYGTLETGWSKPYETRSGTVWLVANAEGQPFGYFTVGDQAAHAVVPMPNP
ncbi:sulfatase-like hydrolase/transferase [Aporhodopirellula aestuarii]|uniref:Sulfatase-like hydrolase/transferase n=1 Tax=Aporhodopirellula aestuarii TaxID=2950107 RepID=A0ABT0U8N1_9BACT|nr:sulfatase-like hydrolase/transferase [Aporhodopirellula aestuarii]MCM2373231.1 sulfatase-like hydrolase/transferase [Aporhodopirellula aestuarii]